MSALTADRKTSYKDGVEVGYPVAAAAKIYAGAQVCANAAGYAVPGADSAGLKFLGIAQEQADNTAGANGALTVKVRRKGVHRLACAGMAQSDVAEKVYISDDQTVAKLTANLIPCGLIAEFVSATEVGVDIEKI